MIPFCEAEHQKAFSKSSELGEWVGGGGKEGPKSPCKGVRFVGERRILASRSVTAEIGPSRARCVTLNDEQIEE